MFGIPCRSHVSTVAFLTAGLAVLPLDLVHAADATVTAPASDTATATPIQRPTGDVAAVETSGSEEAEPAGAEERGEAEAPAEAEATDESGLEIPEATSADPPTAAPGSTGETTPPADLLEAAPPEPTTRSTPPPRTLRPRTVDPDEYEAAVHRSHDAHYRPASNPGRLNLGVRTLFANAGGGDRVGGRMGGLQVDLGQSFNRIGYAITAQAWGGRVFLSREDQTEMNAMFGVGPTLNLGRLALQGNGFLDLRVGYDFFYGVVNQRRESPTVVTPTVDSDVALVQAENLVPHGPRVQLNMGLLVNRGAHQRFIHGLGVTAGYQGLVHSFRGDLPYTHMLTLGLSYWMG
jgi:hypothetical protein